MKIKINFNPQNYEFIVYCSKYSKKGVSDCSIEMCSDCRDYGRCELWKDGQFNDYFKDNNICLRCKLNQIERGFLWIIYKLKNFVNKKEIPLCCECIAELAQQYERLTGDSVITAGKKLSSNFWDWSKENYHIKNGTLFFHQFLKEEKRGKY